MRKAAQIAVIIFIPLFVVLAQDAVPAEIQDRTIFIKVGNEAGTGFLIDYEGKLYLVTARHVAAGLPTRDATVQVWQEEQWKDYHTVKTIFPSSDDVDIAIFATNEKASKPYTIRPVGDHDGVTMGQQVWFLGYPFGIASHFANGQRAPFIKRGIMSAIDASNPDAIVVYIDAFNNPGFSGGPIVYWDFSKHVYGILGVVKGYREDAAKVLINGQHVDTQILVNTGILVAYSIKHAIKAIEDSSKLPTAQ